MNPPAAPGPPAPPGVTLDWLGDDALEQLASAYGALAETASRSGPAAASPSLRKR